MSHQWQGSLFLAWAGSCLRAPVERMMPHPFWNWRKLIHIHEKKQYKRIGPQLEASRQCMSPKDLSFPGISWARPWTSKFKTFEKSLRKGTHCAPRAPSPLVGQSKKSRNILCTAEWVWDRFSLSGKRESSGFWGDFLLNDSWSCA